MFVPTAEVEVPTDLVRRLLAGQHLPHEELTEGDGAFHQPASRPTAPTGAGRFTNRLRPGESGATVVGTAGRREQQKYMNETPPPARHRRDGGDDGNWTASGRART